MDIVICMNNEDFLHKTQAGYFYWSMGRAPKNFKEGDKIFIVINTSGGKYHVMGYVECFEFNPEDISGETIAWKGESFTYIDSILCKHFRGFRYRWFDYKLEVLNG